MEEICNKFNYFSKLICFKFVYVVQTKNQRFYYHKKELQVFKKQIKGTSVQFFRASQRGLYP